MPRATSWPRLFCQAAVPLLLSTCLSTPVFAQESTIETVTVTAQKREQNVQDVPVSMTVLGGQQIANLQTRDLKALQNYIPNLYVARTGVNDVVYIRGFGSGVNNIAFDMDVSIYQDGVYGGRSAQFTAPFFDVDRIEVLRGPQGALFGKNTAAGAISIVTAGPTDTFEAKGTVSYDFIQKGPELNGYIAGPISDTLGARLAVTPIDELDHFRRANSRLQQGVGLPVHIERQVHRILNERDFCRRLDPAQAADDRPAIDKPFGSKLARQRIIEVKRHIVVERQGAYASEHTGDQRRTALLLLPFEDLGR